MQNGFPGPGPVIVYFPGSGTGPIRPGAGPSIGPATSGNAPTIGPDTNLGGLLSLDPVRSVGDAPLYGSGGGKSGWPVFGRLPTLGVPAPAENPIGRALAGHWSVLNYGNDEVTRYLATRKNSSGNEKIWWELNGGTWPVIKMNGAQKYAAAKSLNSMIDATSVEIGRRRQFSNEHLRTLKELEAELLSDLAWQAGDGAAARAVLAESVNATAALMLGVLSALGPPQGLAFNALYGSLDAIFRSGAVFDAAAWKDAIEKALVEAGAEDVLTRGGLLRSLLLEFAKFAKRLVEVQDTEDARKELRREIERQLELIRSEVQKYQAANQGAGLLEAVAQELNRQPKYVIAVVDDYQRFTGSRVAITVPGQTTYLTTAAAFITLPAAIVLAIRSREAHVATAEGPRRRMWKLATRVRVPAGDQRD